MDKERDFEFNFTATGIGSIPRLDARETCLNILQRTPEIPFWPQLVKRSRLEDFFVQYSEGLPLLSPREDATGLMDVPTSDMEVALTDFYEHFLMDDVDYFRISQGYAAGLYELLEIVSEDPDGSGRFIKGHTAGPVTFVAGIKGEDGRSMLSNPDLRDAYTKGIAIKALWQVRRLEETGKRPIIFLDEPYLSGFGSAFSPIERHEVIDMLKEVMEYIRERSDVLIGIHCCGNTDWSMLIDSNPDIINFDAFGYLDYFLLYPDEISRFIRGGGYIAWGIVPTADFKGTETVEDLRARLEQGLKRLEETGLSRKLIAGRSLLTPACGMGTMSEASSDRVLELLSMLSADMKGL